MGRSSLYSNTNGRFNTAVGSSAGFDITTGENNTVLGYSAEVPFPEESNQVRIGNTDITYAGIQVDWSITSDIRWKDNITPSNLGLNFISKLNPVSYTRKNDDKKRIEYGLIAQELEEVLKNEGLENLGMLTTDSKGYYELRYNDLLAPMIKSIQELKKENDELKTTTIKLQVANDELKTSTIELTKRLTNFEQLQNILVAEIEMLKTNNNENVKVSLGGK